MKKALLLLTLFLAITIGVLAQRKIIIPLVNAETHTPINAENGYVTYMMDEDSVALQNIQPGIFSKVEKGRRKVYLQCITPKYGSYILSLSVLGYQHIYYELDIQKEDKRKTIEMEPLSLLPDKEVIALGEAMVTAPKLKFYFDRDTLVYNADGYLRQEGSMLSNILQKMPGLEIKPDGEIFSNGKRVDVLLLNGKDFFNEDRVTLLGNLPAYAVKQVKVYEADNKGKTGQTERERMRGGQIMDIVLKPDFQSANFGNLDLGGGTTERYYTKIFGMRYGTHYRLSGFAMSNNINRNENLQLDGTSQNIDNGIGEKQHHKMGMNYNYDDYKGRFSLRGAAQLLWSETDMDVQQAMQRFLPAGDVFSTTSNHNRLRDFSFSTQHEINPFAKSSYSFLMKPQLSYTRNNHHQLSRMATTNADATTYSTNWLDTLWAAPYSEFFQLYGVNRQQTQRHYMGEATTASLNASKARLSINEDHHLSLNAAWNFYTHNNRDYTQRQIDYVATPADNVWQNQFMKETATRHNAEGTVDYTFEINKRHSLLAQYSANYVYYDTNHSLFALDALNGWKHGDAPALGLLPSQREMLSVIDQQNSYAYTERQQQHKVALGYSFGILGGGLQITAPLNFEKKHLDFTQREQTKRVDRSFFLPGIDVEFSRMIPHKPYIMFGYHLRQQSPTLYNLVDMENTSNPLFVQRGNPDLKAEQQHRFVGQYFLPKGMGHHNLYTSGTIRTNAVAQSSSYEKESGRTVLQPRNVNGNYSIGFNLRDKFFLNHHATAAIENDMSVDFARSVDYISLTTQSEAYRSKVFHRLIKEKITYDQSLLRQHLRFSISAYCHYNRYSSEREGFETINSFDFGGKAVVNAELPWGVSLSTDLTSVSRRGYNYSMMNTDEFLWNARLTKAFSEHLQIQLEVNDILANRKNVYHLLNAQSRVEEVYNGLRRFGMVHFIWRLGKTPRQHHHTH